jgi:hypothetical protein
MRSALRHPQRNEQRTIRWILCVLCSLFSVFSLSGCLLISGANQSADSTGEGGNVYVSFVSAEGNDTRTVQTNFPAQTLDLTVFVRNERGQMRIEVLDDRGSVALSIEGTAQEQVRPGQVRTNAAGEFRYRVRATGAQRGEFQILYQPTGS